MSASPPQMDENDPSRPILSREELPRRSSSDLARSTSLGESDGANVRLNVLRGSQEQGISRANMRYYALALTFINIPQAVAAIGIVAYSWNRESCRVAPLSLWAVVQAVRLVASVYLTWGLQEGNLDNATHQQIQHYDWLQRIKSPVDNFGLVWLVMGNIWMFSAEESCVDSAPMLFYLCSTMIYIGFIGIFLPCIMVLLMLPFVCFCLPCVLRVLFTVNGKKMPGATAADLSKLETAKYTNGMFGNGGEDQCSICLNTYEEEEEMRIMPCDGRHHFHKECVDEWLLMNATCPICRASINDDAEQEIGQEGEDSQRLVDMA